MEQKNYNLSKVKLSPVGGLKAVYQVTENIGGEPSVTDYNVSVSRNIHSDLRFAFDELRYIVANVFNFTGEQLSNIDVRGVSWAGSDDNAGVVISAMLETAGGQKTSIKTPRLKLVTKFHGFEEDLVRLTDTIQSEVYKYLFEGKDDKMSVFGAPGCTTDM